jgi:type II secretory pathway predicted ATPase ExeA
MKIAQTFKFRYPPFSDTFEVREPFLSKGDKAHLSRTLSFISQGKSLCIYGEPGTGKSMLLKAICSELDTKRYQVAIIPYGDVKRNSLLRELCDEFGIDASGRGSLLGRLRKYFNDSTDRPFPVMIVDDAHAMERESFTDLCNLLHTVKSRTSAASLILCGHGCLKKMLGLDIYAPVKTRMSCMFRVASLEPDEALDFIKHRLKIAGADEGIMEEDALHLIVSDAKGNRREIMNRCALAMELAAERKEKLVTADLVHSMELS